jgi:hypothetical protein
MTAVVLLERVFKLNDINLDLPMRNIVNHLDNLWLASHKVEEVDRLISEQEWKIKHSASDFHLSFLSYVGMFTTGIVMIICCYCCCVVRGIFQVFQNGGEITPVPL